MNLILPLLPERAQPYAKAVLALVMSLLTALSEIYTDVEALTVALALLTAAGVYAQPNLGIPDGTGKRRDV